MSDSIVVESESELRRKLETGWEWMKNNPTHPALNDFWVRWEDANQRYMETYGVEKRPDVPLPPPNPWIEELRGELASEGAEVDPFK